MVKNVAITGFKNTVFYKAIPFKFDKKALHFTDRLLVTSIEQQFAINE